MGGGSCSRQYTARKSAWLLIAHCPFTFVRRTLLPTTCPAGSNHLVTSILVQGVSDIGRVRRRNEDSFALSVESGLAVVADGMGGHPGGDIASQVSSQTAIDVLREASAELSDPHRFAETAEDHMERAVLAAHTEVRARGVAEPELDGMGTTLTAMIAHPETRQWVIGHVGDSRVYRLRGTSLDQLTRDDTWVQQQIDNDIMNPDQARRSAYAHLLTQCIGLEEVPTPQVLKGVGEQGDRYLLCTDGLVGMLSDEEITQILSKDSAPEALLSELIDAANEAGGHDNITAALLILE